MFTDAELEDAVLNYLTSEATTRRGVGGSRDVLATKTQVYEIISAAFMLRPSAVFAVVWLATNALRALCEAQINAFEEIAAAAPRVSKTSRKVESVTDLHNAEASLVNLTAAFSARSAGVSGAIGPGVQRFNASVERFMRQELAKNTVENGDVVATPEELRERALALWAEAKPRHEEILASIERIRGVLTTYGNVRLPDAVVGSLLVRMQERLQQLTEQMAATTAPRDSRQALLELSAMRTLLTQAARFRPPERKKAPLVGDSTTGVLVGTVGTPAGMAGTKCGPFTYAPNSSLTYKVAGVTAAVALPGSTNVELEDVVVAINADARVNAVAVRQRLDTFTGQPMQGTPVLHHYVATGTGMSGNGTRTLHAGIDLEALGVEPGMVFMAGSSILMTVEAVDGSAVTLNATLVGGPFVYFIGPDYTFLPAGAAVRLSGTVDAGLYRVATGSYAQITLDRPLTSASPVQAHVTIETLSLVNKLVGPAQTLEVVPSAAATALGLSTANPPKLQTFETYSDLGARGVEPGDQVMLQLGANTFFYSEVTSIDGSLVQLKDPAPYQAGSLVYAIENAAVVEYDSLRGDLFNASEPLVFEDSVRLDQALARLGRGARYTGDVQSTLTDYLDGLGWLREICLEYEVPRDPTVEQAMRLMQEHGFDRAADLFVQLRLDEFFALDAEGVSYKTWLYRKAADTARAVTPVTKDTRDPTSGWRTVATSTNRE